MNSRFFGLGHFLGLNGDVLSYFQTGITAQFFCETKFLVLKSNRRRVGAKYKIVTFLTIDENNHRVPRDMFYYVLLCSILWQWQVVSNRGVGANKVIINPDRDVIPRILLLVSLGNKLWACP